MHITNKGSGWRPCKCLIGTYNDVSPRESQDDKILPKHPKFNPKLNPFIIILKMRN